MMMIMLSFKLNDVNKITNNKDKLRELIKSDMKSSLEQLQIVKIVKFLQVRETFIALGLTTLE